MSRGGIGRMMRWALALTAGVVVGLVSVARAGELRADGRPLPVIEIWKAKRQLWLERDGQVIRKFRISLGVEPQAPKLRQGDGRTPVGTYYVSEKRPKSPFRRFLGISYPNVDDAERGFAAHLISADQWADILFANLRREPPPWRTPLGGRVGIHGFGGRPAAGIDWTEGCVAVSDDAIDYLYAVVPVGTPVHIHD
jgi:hypothetical protein